MSVAGLLGIVFVTLKLLGVIAWPWIWVTAPFWAGLALFVIFAAIIALLKSLA